MEILRLPDSSCWQCPIESCTTNSVPGPSFLPSIVTNEPLSHCQVYFITRVHLNFLLSKLLSSVDIEAIQNAINFLKGEHDFASFCTKNKRNKEKSTVKTIDEFEIRPCYPLSEYELRSDLYSHIQFYEFYVKSKSFLYNQV